MTSKPCFRCNRHWAFNSGEGFEVITKFCPECIPLVFPPAGTAPLPRGLTK